MNDRSALEAEQQLREAINLEAAESLIHTFAGLVRESGTDAEREAARYIAQQLGDMGVPHMVHMPTLFISLPRRASVAVTGRDGAAATFAAKTVAMSRDTGIEGIRAPLRYVPTGFAKGTLSLFDGAQIDGSLQGQIALTEGLPMPAKVKQFSDAGAVAAIFISPGERIHEGICTTIWGAPDLGSEGRQPQIAVAELARSDGVRLVALAKEAREPLTACVTTALETGWVPCPVVVAEIPGSEDPETFVLLHGHIDSWHEGIGDNATGDATLLEMARVFWQQRGSLKRTVKIAWWPGHSTGRYAGSTWFADTFAQDLVENAIASVNCDSPGCRDASEYRDLTSMSELFALTEDAIKDACGLAAERARPSRAGDYSFNNLGVPATLMLSSTMPEALAQQKGYYAVGGCGGNIAWHTEDDLLDVYSPEMLLRDMRVYATVVMRLANAALHPIDLRAATAEFRATLGQYEAAAAERYRFESSRAELDTLDEALARFYEKASSCEDAKALRLLNEGLRAASRKLVRVNYARSGPYRQDPALEVPPLPDLRPAQELAGAEAGSHRAHVLCTELRRGENRLVGALRGAARDLKCALALAGLA